MATVPMTAKQIADSEAAGQALLARYNTPTPATPYSTNLSNGVDQFKATNWQNGTATGLTPTQNISNTAATNQADLVQRQQTQSTQNQTPTPVRGGDYFQTNAAPTLPQGSQPATVPIPTPQMQQQSLYKDPFARSREDIAKLAKDRIDKILQAGRTSADGARTGAKNAYDYTNIIEGDNRTLRNASMKESANPFGGNFGYQAAMNNRNDSIQDTAQDKDYNAQVGLINQKLADLEAAAPGDEQAIIDQLEQIERQTGINVAQLQEQQKQNQFNNGMQNKQFNQQQQVIDYNQNPNNPSNQGQVLQNQGQAQQNLLNQYKIDDYPAEQKANATKIQQELAAGKMNLETAEYNLKQMKDPNSPANLAAKLDLQMKQIDASTYSQENKLKLQQLQKEIAQIGVVHYKPQTATEIAMDKANLELLQGKVKELQNPKSKAGTTAEEYASNLKPQYDSDNNLTNGQNLEDQIILSGLSDYEQFKLYKKYGLTWDDPIPQK